MLFVPVTYSYRKQFMGFGINGDHLSTSIIFRVKTINLIFISHNSRNGTLFSTSEHGNNSENRCIKPDKIASKQYARPHVQSLSKPKQMIIVNNEKKHFENRLGLSSF